MSSSITPNYPFTFPILLVGEASPDIVARRTGEGLETVHGPIEPEKYYPGLKIYDSSGKVRTVGSFHDISDPRPLGFFEKLLKQERPRRIQFQLGFGEPYELNALKEILAERLSRDTKYWHDDFKWDTQESIQQVRNSMTFDDVIGWFED